MTIPLLGLRTTIYKVSELATAREWYSRVFGITPYFNEAFYVGFNVGGFELGLDPDVSEVRPGPGGGLAYWGVSDIAAAFKAAADLNARVVTEPVEVGEGIKVGAIEDPFGNVIGLIENPHFGK